MTDIDEELAALYRVARRQAAPSQDDRIAVRAAVASALAVTTVAASTQAAAGGVASAAQAATVVSLGKLVGWLLVGAAFGGVTSSVAWVTSSQQTSQAATVAPLSATVLAPVGGSPKSPTPPAVAASVSVPEASVKVATRGPASVAPAASRETARGGHSASRTAARAVGREAARAQRSPGLAASSLGAESEGLLAIQRALSDRDASSALKMVGDQDAQFGAGVLAEERAVVRVLALCAAGQTGQARLARERFVSVYPRSPHSKRVFKSCAGQ